MIEFFWNYLFDASSVNYLDLNLATKALSALSELLRLSSVELIVVYFGRIIENIKKNESSYFSVMVAAQFLRLFFNKDSVTRVSLVDSFQKDHQLLNLLIQELSNYMTKVREQVE